MIAGTLEPETPTEESKPLYTCGELQTQKKIPRGATLETMRDQSKWDKGSASNRFQ